MLALATRNVHRETGGGKVAAFVLRCCPPTVFRERRKMTRKRKRDSEPPETGSDMELEGVPDAQNNTRGATSAAKKRPKTKKKNTQPTGRGPLAPKPKITKLKPARPYPTVPTSSSATVPKSRRAEGRNKVCVTRRTELGSYLRQCREVLTKDGYVHTHPLELTACLPSAQLQGALSVCNGGSDPARGYARNFACSNPTVPEG
jgi:hypothetical protein